MGQFSMRGLQVAQVVKNTSANARDSGFNPWVGNIPGEGNGNPLQYPCLENSMERGAWQAIVHGLVKSRTLLSDFHSLPWRTFNFMTCRVFIVSVSVHSKCSGESSFLLFNHLRN